MFACVVRLRPDPQKVEAFVRTFEEYGPIFLRESGTLVYRLGQSRTEAGTYRAIEIYENEEAFKAHTAGETFQAFRPLLVSLLAEPPSSERLDLVV